MTQSTIYLAAPFHRRAELANYADKLRTAGLTVTSTWLDTQHAGIDETAHTTLKALWAHTDLEDIERADTFLLFTSDDLVRGGCFVEFGYALRAGKRCVVIGPRTNVFTHHLHVAQCDSFAEWWDRVLVGVGV